MPRWLKTSLTAGKAWNQDNAFQHSAAVAFYTLFSLAPIMIIAVGIAGFFLGKESAQRHLTDELTQLVGAQSAKVVKSSMEASMSHQGNLISTIVGIVLLIVGATSVFGQMQESLNQLWGVRTKPSKSGIMLLVVRRLISLAMVIVIGFLLLVSLVISTALTGMVHSLSDRFTVPPQVLHGIDFIVALVVVTALFGCLFKVLPDVQLRWKEVAKGALVTAVLFGVGRFLIALYLGHSTVASVYGAAGSLVALLVWIYYSCAIVFFGVEVLKASHVAAGLKIRPKATAVVVREEIVPS